MDETTAVDLAREALLLAVKLALPALLAGVLVGLLVSILQAATQVQEQSLSFVPRLLAVGVTLLLLAGWMMTTLVEYARVLYGDMGGRLS